MFRKGKVITVPNMTQRVSWLCGHNTIYTTVTYQNYDKSLLGRKGEEEACMCIIGTEAVKGR